MQRGILQLSRDEFNAMISKLDMVKFEETPLSYKLKAAYDSTDSLVRIEVSEDELEIILDEIGIPDPQSDTEILKTVRTNITNILVRFRSLE